MPSRPNLQARPTTQLSYANTQTYSDELKDESTSSGTSRRTKNYFGLNASRNTSDVEDTGSLKSFAPTVEGGDAESMLGELYGDRETSVLQSLGPQFAHPHSASLFPENPAFEEAFAQEFDDIEEMKADGSNEGQTTRQSVESQSTADPPRVYRSHNAAMARQTKTLSHSVFSRQAHLQPPW
jgi:hypothetical protein